MNQVQKRCLSALLLVTFAFVGLVSAQDKASPGAATAVASPVVVISTGKLDRLVSHISYLMRAVNQPEVGGLVSLMVNQYSRGLDKSRPAAVTLNLNEAGNPDPVVMLPIADMDSFLAGLAPIAGDPDPLENGVMMLEVSARPIFFKELGDWLVAGMHPDVVEKTTAVPVDSIIKLANQFDIGVRFDSKAVPPNLRDELMSQMRTAFDRGMSQQMASADRRLKQEEAEAADSETKARIAAQREALKSGQEVQAMQMKQIEEMILSLNQLVVGLTIDSDGKQVVLESAVEFQPGSKLAERVRKTAETPSKFTTLTNQNTPITLRATDVSDPTQVEAAEKSIGTFIENIAKPFLKENEIPISDATLADLSSVIKESMREGVGDMGATIEFVDGLHCFVGSRVADGAKVAQLVKKAASEVKPENYGAQLQFDAYAHQGTTVHLGSIPLPKSNPVPAMIFGEVLKFAIGTSDKMVCLAFGAKCEDCLKASIEKSSGKATVPEAPFALRVEGLPLIQYISELVPNPALNAMVSAVQSASDRDMLVVGSRVIPNGMVFRLTIEEGLLKAVGAAVKAGQNPGRF
jgi:hypothetical protein